jgi:hypothetical protein
MWNNDNISMIWLEGPLMYAWVSSILFREKVLMEERLHIWRKAMNIWNEQSRTADKGWFSSFSVRQGASNAL